MAGTSGASIYLGSIHTGNFTGQGLGNIGGTGLGKILTANLGNRISQCLFLFGNTKCSYYHFIQGLLSFC